MVSKLQFAGCHYTGIGSRATPDEILTQMYRIAEFMAQNGAILRSGGAVGADSAFESGCDQARGLAEIYTVKNFFSAHPLARDRAEASVDKYHPNPTHLNRYVRTLMARNYFQVMGSGMVEIPTCLVICYTPQASGRGGTGQAIRIADDHDIPVYDMGHPNWSTESFLEGLCE